MSQEMDLRRDAQVLIAMRYGWVPRKRMAAIDGDQIFTWLAQATMPRAKRRHYVALLKHPLANAGLHAVAVRAAVATADGLARDLLVVTALNGQPIAGSLCRLVVESAPAGQNETGARPVYRLCNGREWSAPALWLVRDEADCPADTDELTDLGAPRRARIPAAG